MRLRTTPDSRPAAVEFRKPFVRGKLIFLIGLALSLETCKEIPNPTSSKDSTVGGIAELSVSPESLKVTSDSGSVELAIETGGDASLEWEVSSEENWLSFAPASGSGSGTVEITYEENTLGSSRTAEIMISSSAGDVSVPIKQTCQREDDGGGGEVPVSPPCHSCGDVHIRTPDGLAYDFQGAGEYVLVASDDGSVVVQARQEPVEDSRRVTVNTAAAVNIAGDRVGVYLDRSPNLYVNGTPTTLDGDRLELPGGGTIYSFPGGYLFRWPSGFLMSARLQGMSYMDIGIARPDDAQRSFAGLLGNLNGIAEDDFATRSGQQLSRPVAFDDLYDVFGNSWRIGEDESLFDYLSGNNTETFTILDFPSGPITAGDLDPADFEAARQACEAAGITDPILLEDCILDVGVTGDNSFTQSGLDSEQPEVPLDVVPPGTPILPEGLIAYYPFNNNANDASGNGNDGTVNGATLAADRFGNANSAYSFDGVDDLIDIGNNVKPPFPVTVSVWVNSNIIDIMGIFRNDQVDDGGFRYGLDIYFPSEGRVTGNYYEGFSAGVNRISWLSNNPVAEIGVWHHLAVAFASHRNITLFWDGMVIPGNFSSSGSGSGMSYSNANGAIGHRRTNTTTPPDRYFNGFLDDIRVYNRALSEEDINVLYHEGGWDEN